MPGPEALFTEPVVHVLLVIQGDSSTLPVSGGAVSEAGHSNTV